MKEFALLLSLTLEYWYISIPMIFFIWCFVSATIFTDDHGDSVFSEVHKARKAIAKKQKAERDALLIEEYRRIKEEEGLE